MPHFFNMNEGSHLPTGATMIPDKNQSAELRNEFAWGALHDILVLWAMGAPENGGPGGLDMDTLEQHLGHALAGLTDEEQAEIKADAEARNAEDAEDASSYEDAGDDMDGDHESALASVYGDNSGYGDDGCGW